jgi:carbamoyl-phosphate synthase large subunit
LCAREGIRLIVPTIDTELPSYARHREAFAEVGTTIPISAPDVIDITFDKRNTFRFLSHAGFPVPEQHEVDEILDAPSTVSFPRVVKPVRGSSSIGVSVVQDIEELKVAAQGMDAVVQSLATGVEYTVSTLVNRDGTCVCAVPRRRLEVRHGEVSKGLTVRHHGLQELAKAVCEALPGAFGPLNVQIFWDETTDTYAVIEINARFGGGFPLAYEAGAHYPKWIMEECLGLSSSANWDSWRENLLMLRYDAAVFVDGEDAG